jgi:hypothetical protein
LGEGGEECKGGREGETVRKEPGKGGGGREGGREGEEGGREEGGRRERERESNLEEVSLFAKNTKGFRTDASGLEPRIFHTAIHLTHWQNAQQFGMLAVERQ